MSASTSETVYAASTTEYIDGETIFSVYDSATDTTSYYNDYNDWPTALNSDTTTTIKLYKDFKTDSNQIMMLQIGLNENSKLMIDLNGHSWKSEYGLSVYIGGSTGTEVSVENGTIEGSLIISPAATSTKISLEDLTVVGALEINEQYTGSNADLNISGTVTADNLYTLSGTNINVSGNDDSKLVVKGTVKYYPPIQNGKNGELNFISGNICLKDIADCEGQTISVTVGENAVVTITGSIGENIENNGTLVLNGATIASGVSVTNNTNGIVQIESDVVNEGTVTNEGNIEINGSFLNKNTVTNSVGATITNNGTVANETGKYIENNGNFYSEVAIDGIIGNPVKKKHVHNFSTEWSKDATNHWNACLTDDCDGTVENKASHISSDWIIDKAATVAAEGSKHKECTVCGYVLENATIQKLENESLPNENNDKYIDDSEGKDVTKAPDTGDSADVEMWFTLIVAGMLCIIITRIEGIRIIHSCERK